MVTINWAICCLAAVCLTFLIRQSECQKAVPVGKTGIYTGVWYVIDLKSGGRLDYSPKKDVENQYNYLFIDRNGTSDCIARDREWTLVSSEKSGRYLLQNRKRKTAAIRTAGKSPSGKWVVAHLGHRGDAEYQEGGKNRDDVLWRVEKSSINGYVNIYNERYADNGIMTWSYEGMSADEKYVQIYDSGSPDSLKTDPDYQWKFTYANGIQGRSIPGTNMFTGIAYRIHLKSKGLLTWSFSKVENKYNYVQIVFGDTEKKDYTEGKRFYKDSIWMINESEKEGFYELVNLGIPDAVIGWAGKSPSGKWVVADRGHVNGKDYRPGGKYRDDVLWRFETEEGPTRAKKYNRFYNARFPGNGIMTWSTQNTGSADRKYCQIYDSGSSEKYNHDSDYLWRLIPIVGQNDIPY